MPAQELAYREKIAKSYKIALSCYATPFAFLALSFAASFFIPFFLLGLLICGIAGTAYTISGLKQAFKNHDHQKKDIGYANLLLGIIMVLAGALVAMFAYVRLN